MKIINLDYTKFNEIKKMLNNQVYWLDKKNNYKIYKFEIIKVSMETIDNKIIILFELYPIDFNIIHKYHSTVEVLYDNFTEECFYSYDAAKKMQIKKLYERQGSLF